MSNYKHGDWYCKPANEAEAHEIVERALASGAELYESVGDGENKYPWNFSRRWGVRNNYTFAGTMDKVWESDVAKEYTIEQVREKFPLHSELQVNIGPHFEHKQKEVVRSDVNVSVGSKPAQWDGKGLPPVGTVCRVRDCSSPSVEIIAHTETNEGRVAVFQYRGRDGILFVKYSGEHYFYPAQTEREQWVLEAQKHCTEFGSNQLGKLYDAIKSGDLKAPEVDK